MKILGINISHNASICLLKDKEISYFEEDRFSRIKYKTPVRDNGHIFFKCIDEQIIKKVKNIPNEVIVTSYDRRFNPLPFSDIEIIEHLKEQLKSSLITWHFFNSEHHLYHAVCGFHFSGFDEAICVIMDGGGAQEFPLYQEIESVYLFNKQEYKKVYAHATNYRFANSTSSGFPDRHIKYNDVEYFFSSSTSSGIKFAQLCEELGYEYPGHDSGKVMGLAAYGKSELDPQGLAMKLQTKTKEDTIKLLKNDICNNPNI